MRAAKQHMDNNGRDNNGDISGTQHWLEPLSWELSSVALGLCLLPVPRAR